MKEFGKRTISGILGAILLIFVVFKGSFYLLFSVYLISLIGLREFYKAIRNINISPIESIGYIGCTLLFLSY